MEEMKGAIRDHVEKDDDDDVRMMEDLEQVYYNYYINNDNGNIINKYCSRLIGSRWPQAEIKDEKYYCLSSRQMESLTALCDTFLPSIALDSDDQSLLNFYATSASKAATPQRMGMLLRSRVKHPKSWLLELGLWGLSTWYGSFILCGTASLSTSFPFFQSFPMLSHQTRQEILLSWSRSYFFLLRIFFKALKFLTLLVFFTQVDEKDQNISWKALGYPGPDPDFKAQTTSTTTLTTNSTTRQQITEEDYLGPLYRGILHLKLNQTNTSVDTLRRLGFHVRPRASKTQPFLTIECDAVVVGSGSGGGVVAGVLAMAGYKVAVLEKGNYYARNNLSLLEGPTMDRMYLSHGLMATEDMDVLLLAGSTVGGGSTINWSASIPTPHHVIHEWCHQYQLQLFGTQLYRQALDVVCHRMQVQSDFDQEGFNNAILRKGCQQLGYPVNNIPRNAPSDHYCGWCCLGCKDGKKKAATETWLLDLVNSGNGAILPGCEAIQVLHHTNRGRDRSTATGVAFEFDVDGSGRKEVCVVESKVTVVACGALRTPTLLKRSGLKNPNIGKHLHLHPVVMAWGYFPAESPNAWPEPEKKSYEGGIMTAMSTGESESGYGVVIQTPALHPGMFSALMPWTSGKDMKERMRRYSRTAHIFALARDKGSGRVKSESSISYAMEAGDEQSLQNGLEKILRILAAAGAEEIGTHHGEGRRIKVKECSNEDQNEFERLVKEESRRSIRGLSTPICSAHQMGSCRMGVSAETSVVNEMGETWEVEGLFLADTSVFPTALGVNPMLTVQAIAYCTAQALLQVLLIRNKKTTTKSDTQFKQQKD